MIIRNYPIAPQRGNELVARDTAFGVQAVSVELAKLK